MVASLPSLAMPYIYVCIHGETESEFTDTHWDKREILRRTHLQNSKRNNAGRQMSGGGVGVA